MNLIKSPHELMMEQAGLPSYAEGHSVSPEQMKVELMINGHKVHQADLPHDHPLIQHFASGGEAEQSILSKLGSKLPWLGAAAEASSIPANLAKNHHFDAAANLANAGAWLSNKAAPVLFPIAQGLEAAQHYHEGHPLEGNRSVLNAAALMAAPELMLPTMGVQIMMDRPHDVPAALAATRRASPEDLKNID